MKIQQGLLSTIYGIYRSLKSFRHKVKIETQLDNHCWFGDGDGLCQVQVLVETIPTRLTPTLPHTLPGPWWVYGLLYQPLPECAGQADLNPIFFLFKDKKKLPQIMQRFKPSICGSTSAGHYHLSHWTSVQIDYYDIDKMKWGRGVNKNQDPDSQTKIKILKLIPTPNHTNYQNRP